VRRAPGLSFTMRRWVGRLVEVLVAVSVEERSDDDGIVFARIYKGYLNSCQPFVSSLHSRTEKLKASPPISTFHMSDAEAHQPPPSSK
jgi:hypothetical protein